MWIDGPAATRFLNETLTCDVSSIAPQRVSYSLVTNDNGGTLDDVLLTNLGDRWLLVVNASKPRQDRRLAEVTLPANGREHRRPHARDGLIAVQGPSAVTTVEKLLGEKLLGTSLADIPYFGVRQVSDHLLVSRTGYTGEDGVELFLRQMKPRTIGPD